MRRAESVISRHFYRNAARVSCHPAKAAAQVLLTQIYRSLTCYTGSVDKNLQKSDMAVQVVGAVGGSVRTSRCLKAGERKSEEEVLQRGPDDSSNVQTGCPQSREPVEQRTAADACRGSQRSIHSSQFQAQKCLKQTT